VFRASFFSPAMTSPSRCACFPEVNGSHAVRKADADALQRAADGRADQHMDMESIESLNLALERYAGTLIFVSHDRQFVSSLATHVIELGKGQFCEYDGSYDDYLLSKGARISPETAGNRHGGALEPPSALCVGSRFSQQLCQWYCKRRPFRPEIALPSLIFLNGRFVKLFDRVLIRVKSGAAWIEPEQFWTQIGVTQKRRLALRKRTRDAEASPRAAATCPRRANRFVAGEAGRFRNHQLPEGIASRPISEPYVAPCAASISGPTVSLRFSPTKASCASTRSVDRGRYWPELAVVPPRQRRARLRAPTGAITVAPPPVDIIFRWFKAPR